MNKYIREIISFGESSVDSLDILLCGDLKYIKYCGITMTSVLVSNPKEKIHFYLVCDDVLSEDLEKLELLCTQYNTAITIYKLNNDIIENLIQGVNESSEISVATFFRLVAFDILSEKLNFILYLDSDIMVIGNIRRFWDISTDDSYGVAIKDVNPRLGIIDYFNAGVLFINLRKWKENDFTSKSIQNILREKYEFMDQDALNVLLQNKMVYLDKRFNFIKGLDVFVKESKNPVKDGLYLNNDIRIIHFVGRWKPWCSWVQKLAIVKAWQNVKRKSPWAETLNIEIEETPKNKYRYKYAHTEMIIAYKNGELPEAVKLFFKYVVYKIMFM